MAYILINNMKMPENCEKCELSKAVITGLSTYRLCPILRRAWRRGKSEPACPLVEVPSSDVTELKNGKWSDEQVAYRDEYGDFHFGYQCSACGAILNKTNYCGACGADMRGRI